MGDGCWALRLTWYAMCLYWAPGLTPCFGIGPRTWKSCSYSCGFPHSKYTPLHPPGIPNLDPFVLRSPLLESMTWTLSVGFQCWTCGAILVAKEGVASHHRHCATKPRDVAAHALSQGADQHLPIPARVRNTVLVAFTII